MTLLFSTLLLVSLAQDPPPKPADVAGKWAITLQTEAFTANPTLELKQEGEKLTGTYSGRYGAFPLTGTIKGRKLQFSFKMTAEGTDVAASYAGEVAADGQSMKGEAELEGLGSATWTATRAKN